MNVRLTYDVDFLSINAIHDRIFPNSYTVKVNLLTISDDSSIQNIAFQRLKFFINEMVNNGLFVDSGHPRLNEFISLLPHKIILLPEPAFDQTIGMVLYCKLNAILNNEMIVDEIVISSTEGDHVGYSIDENDNFAAFADSQLKKKNFVPWWKREDITTVDTKTTIQKFNWADIELSWNKDDNLLDIEFCPEFEIDEVVVPKAKESRKGPAKKPAKKSTKNATKNSVILDIDTGNVSNKNFNPTIINGGKNTDEAQ